MDKLVIVMRIHSISTLLMKFHASQGHCRGLDFKQEYMKKEKCDTHISCDHPSAVTPVYPVLAFIFCSLS